MSTKEAILRDSSNHAQLLAQIIELDYVPPALQYKNTYIATLEKFLMELENQISRLKQTAIKKERQKHEAMRDTNEATTDRIVDKITRRKEKVETKASKEKDDLMEAPKEEKQAKREEERMKTMIAEGKAVRADLQEKLQLYNKTKQDLAELYRKIFDGPTPAYPQDDQLEYELQQAQSRYTQVQGFLHLKSQAVGLFELENTEFLACKCRVQEVLDSSPIGSGATMSDMMKRCILAAKDHAAQTQILPVHQARIQRGKTTNAQSFM
ncbi:hypothetical protein DFH08DRAFT_956275 [Mycena albidolilacea]|uniref:Uncharacterized protein n=1 Tax=Mycena albidolilacea TaxID=1033008 RepID=A0AAD7AB04_9AGAR|nr:hypothetical protein DFH08DRAFT_956275 [Mycena albidolilacea]